MSSIFPFIDTTLYEEDTDTDELEELCEYAYDFENNCLKKDESGKNYYVYGNEALKIWIYKSLMTPRFRHLAYSEEYGNEMFDLVSEAIHHDVLFLELKRFITEALMYNEYIRELNSFEFYVDGSSVQISFTVISVYGEMDYEQTVVGGVG